MSNFSSAAKFILAFSAVAAVSCGVARAAALMGESRKVVLPPAPVAEPDEVRAKYRRPLAIPFPPNNPYTGAKARLGNLLYNDTRLSATATLSCASCHNPGFAYGDGLPKAIGNGMKQLRRRSPSIVNSAWSELFMWDGRSMSLEDQALGPIVEPTEMNQPLPQLVSRISAIEGYRALFELAFPHQAITPQRIAEAIATHERTIVSGLAAFDMWIEGDETAIPDAAKRGFNLFNTRATCASCHSGWLMSDNGLHDTGLPDDDQGRGTLFPAVVKMQHAFKTPGLRDVANRGPYMHDGSLPTLAAVVAHYNDGGVDRPSRSELITPLGLSAEEQADIVAFLNTLTSSIEPGSATVFPR